MTGSVGVALPRWKCHKEVSAAKITEVRTPQGECIHAIGLTTCGYTSDKHFKHGGGPMDHTFTPQDVGNVGPLLTLEGGGFVEIEPEYLVKHKPQVGGYYVVYDDGYKSFSPAETFEGGYTRL